MNRKSLVFAPVLSLWCSLFLAAPCAQSQPSPALSATPTDAARTAAAQQRFDRGRALFERNDHAQAILEFRGALELYPSPNTRLYVGLCLVRLGQLAEAHTELQRTFSEARDRATTDPRYVSARDISEREMNAIRPRLGRLVINTSQRPGGLVMHANNTEVLVPMLGIELFFDPGEVTVTAAAPGFVAFHQTVRLMANTATEVRISLENVPVVTPPVVQRPPQIVTSPSVQPTAPMRDASTITVSESSGGGVRVAGYVVGGLGLASFAGFALFGNMARSQFEQVRTECRGRCTAASYNTLIDQGESDQLYANIALGAGIALTITGVVMIAVGGPRPVDERGDTRRSSLRPILNLEQRTLGVAGAF
jgi:hypothetical protein